MDLNQLSSVGEWSKCKGVNSTHTSLFFSFSTSSRVIKCLWYALSSFSIHVNLRSVMRRGGG